MTYSHPLLSGLPAQALSAQVNGNGRITVVRSRTQLEACQGIRLGVFVNEQGVPIEEEIDDADYAPTTIHFLLTIEVSSKSIPVGTARLLIDPNDPSHAHVGRVAIVKKVRGSGLGRPLMEFISHLAQRILTPDPNTGEITLELSSQIHAMGFYERLGYRDCGGETYLDAGIEHRDMKLTLPGL